MMPHFKSSDLLAISAQLICVSVKNLTVLTSGAPADIGIIEIPSWVTRWCPANGTGLSLSRVIAESAAGTLSAGSIQIFNGPNGTGNQITGAVTLPTAANSATGMNGNTVGMLAFSTSGTVYIRQTANSANAGTISVYLTIVPLL